MATKQGDRHFGTTRDVLERAGMNEVVRVITKGRSTVAEIKLVSDWVRKTFGAMGMGFDGGDDDAVLDKMYDWQKGHVITSSPDYVPGKGEIAYRAAAKTALLQALHSGYEYFIVGDDDMVPSKTFMKEWRELMNEGCGQYMSGYGGVLMLGASEWNNRWKDIDAVVYQGCYDIHDRALGSFAVLYNRHGAMMVLEELDKRPNIPFDHAFYQVALQGGFTAVAMPNLFVADHRHKTSSVNKKRRIKGNEMETRIKSCRWDVSRYDWPPPPSSFRSSAAS